MVHNLRLFFALLLCLIFTLFLALPASAQNSYLLFKGGLYEPASDELENFDSGFTGEIAFGYHFNRTLAIELGLGYLETEGNRVPAFSNIETESVPITASLKGFLPFTAATSFYGLAGIGAWFSESEFRSGGITVEDDDTSFGVQLGVGFNYDLNRTLFFGVEGKYFWSKAEFQALGIRVDEDLKGLIVTGNFGIRF